MRNRIIWILILILSMSCFIFSGCVPYRMDRLVEKVSTLDYDKIYELYDEDKYMEAYEIILEHLKRHPDDFDALYEKAYVLLQIRRDEEAILLIDKLLQELP